MTTRALVVGGAGAIGGAVARRLARRGMSTTVWDRVPAPDVVTLDVRDGTALDAAAAALFADGCDVVVYAAGVYERRPLPELSPEYVTEVLNVNLAAAIRLLRTALPTMAARGGGRIVLVGSQAGHAGGTDLAYAASKAGLHAVTRAVCREHARAGVVINTVSPGPVAGGMNAALGTAHLERQASELPGGRLVSTDEVAEVVEWLACDAPAAVNGTCVDVDCGQLRR